MNYLSIYNSIVKNAKSQGRKKTKPSNPNHIYYEKHHIIPRSIMKARYKSHLMNQKWNLVLLTAREHFICHRLLERATKNTRYHNTMLNAMVGFMVSKNQTIKYSKDFDRVRKFMALKINESISSEDRILHGIKCSENGIGFHSTRYDDLRFEWRRRGVETQKRNGGENFYYWASLEGRKRRASMGGKAGSASQIKTLGRPAFVHPDPEIRKVLSSKAGKCSGKKSVTNGISNRKLKTEEDRQEFLRQNPTWRIGLTTRRKKKT